MPHCRPCGCSYEKHKGMAGETGPLDACPATTSYGTAAPFPRLMTTYLLTRYWASGTTYEGEE